MSFERLGMKGAAFARMTGISYPTFATWIQNRRHARGDYRMRPPAAAGPGPGRGLPVAPGVRFVEAELAVPDCQDAVMLTAPQEKISMAPACGGRQAPVPLPVELPGGARMLPGGARMLPSGTRMLVGDERQAVLAARVLEALSPVRPC